MRRTTWTWVLPLVLAGAGATAAAHPAPEPLAIADERPPIEWSTWLRLGYGARAAPATDAAARVVTPPPTSADRRWGWDAAAGADLTLGLGTRGDLRVGPWAETRGLRMPVAGGELLIGAVPRKLDLFFYDGEGVLIVRAGGNRDVVTGAIAYGYRCPWRLWGPWRGTTRYMIGVRVVATATRSVADPRDWSMTLGLEAEPVGALRYLLGIRSWY